MLASSVLLFQDVVHAQTSDLTFHHLTIADGLSQNSVSAVLQDRQGFLWFGTQDGLDRFDGRTFVNHRNSARANSLANNYVWALHEDSVGALWIGTFGGGLDRLDPATGVFQHFRHDPSDTTSLPSDRIFSMVQDDRGTLWLGTNNGLAALDPRTGKVRRFFAQSDQEPQGNGHFVSGLARLGDDVWMRTDSGLTRMDTRTLVATHFRRAPNTPSVELGAVTSAAVENGEVLICCSAGLVRLGNGMRPDSLLLSPAQVPGADPRMSFNRVRVAGDRWWIGTSHGLVQWLPSTGKAILLRHDATDPRSLAHSNVLALLPGHGGELWIGTRNGLDRLDHADPAIKVRRSKPGQPGTLSDRHVGPMIEDADGTLWIGTASGLDHWDRQADHLQAFRHDPTDPRSLPADDVQALYRDSKNRLWAGFRGGGLAQVERSAQGIRCTNHAKRDAPGALNANTVHTITESSDGLLWIGTAGGGLCSFDAETERFTCYPPTSDDRGPSHPYVYCILEDADAHLWLGTPTGGLNFFDRKSGRFVVLKNDVRDNNSLSSDFVLCLHRDGNDLWIGTISGLNHLRIDNDLAGNLLATGPAAARFTHYGRDHGLPNEVVYGILPSADGTLWLSTNRGLAEFDPKAGRVIRSLSQEDGLQHDEFNQNAFLRTAAGELFFGGVDGLNWFTPADLLPNAKIPPVHFTRFLLNNEPVPLVSDSTGAAFTLQHAIHAIPSLDLSWRDKVIGFEFAVLNYIAPQKNNYRYKLEGFDADWVDAGARNSITYTNLDPGEYVLRVQGSNNDGLWNEQGASLTLRISTPPWRTWYAYLFYALVLIAIGYAWFRYRLREATRELETTMRIERARNADREQFRRKSAADFHDEAGGKLTRINLHTGLAKQRAGQEAAIGPHLEHIEQAQRELSAGIRDLIWSMDPGRDTLHDVLDRLAAFAASLFDRTNTAFRIEGRTEAMRTVKLDMEQRRAITLILKEAMNNCAKYAAAAHCTLQVAHTAGSLSLTLKDDGKGFDTTQAKPDSYGMRTMPERAASIGAELHIGSEPDRGTKIRLTVPVK